MCVCDTVVVVVCRYMLHCYRYIGTHTTSRARRFARPAMSGPENEQFVYTPPLCVTLSLSLACANQNLIRSTQPDTPRPERIIICASCTRPIPCEAQYNIVCIRACITFNIAGELSVSVTRFEIDFIARDRYTIEIWKIYLKRFQKSKRVRTIVLYLLIHFRNRCNGNYYLCTYHVVSALKRL